MARLAALFLIQNALLHAASQQIALENYDDSNVRITQRRYFASVEIGSPPQAVRLLFDTASAYVRVDSAACGDCLSEARFSPRDSETFRLERNVLFGKAPAQIGQDVLAFGDFHLSNQTLAVLGKNSGKDYRGFDGLLVNFTQGLAFEYPDIGDVNLLENLKQRNEIARQIFAVYLNKGSSPAEGSVLSFGSYDLARYSSDQSFMFVPVSLGSGLWTLDISQVRLGGELIDSSQRTAVIVSAYDLTYMPKVVYDKLWAHLCECGLCMEDEFEPYWNCGSLLSSTPSDLTFKLGGLTFTLTGQDLTLRRKKKMCYLGFRTKPNLNYWILGTQFMQKYYLLFDADESRVGFAVAKHAETFSSEFLTWAFVLGVWGILAIPAGIYCYKKWKNRNQPEEPLLPREEPAPS